MSDVALFTSTGIPPRFGQNWEAYEGYVRSVQAHADAVQKVLKSWEDGSWTIKDNPVFPQGCPVIASSFPEYITNFFDIKVRLDPETVLYVPMVKMPKESKDTLSYAVLRTQRRNVFGKEPFRDGIVSAMQTVAGQVPYTDNRHYLLPGLVAFTVPLVMLYAGLVLNDVPLTASLAALESVVLSAAIAGPVRSVTGVRTAYESARTVAKEIGKDALAFLPGSDIRCMAEGMDGASMREHIDQQLAKTGYVTYEFARDSIK